MVPASGRSQQRASAYISNCSLTYKVGIVLGGSGGSIVLRVAEGSEGREGEHDRILFQCSLPRPHHVPVDDHALGL